MFNILIGIWAASIFSNIVLNMGFIVAVIRKEEQANAIMEYCLRVLRTHFVFNKYWQSALNKYPKTLFWLNWSIGMFVPYLSTLSVIRTINFMVKASK